MTKPLLIAHRGDTKNYLENTFEAFNSAFQKGADGIEFDVHLNEHNQPIVVHNYSFDTSLEYPLLSGVCERFKDKGLLEIEIKSLNLNCLDEVKQVIDHHQLINFKLTTSVQPLLHHMRDYFPKADIGVIFRRWLIEDWMTEEFVTEWTAAHLHLSGANYLHLDLDQWTPYLAATLKKNGYKLHSHLKTSDITDYQMVFDLQLDTCTFDDIDLLEKL